MTQLFPSLIRRKPSAINISLDILLFSLCLSMSVNSHAEKTSTELQQEISKANSTLKSSRSVSDKLEKNVHIAEDKLNSLSKELHNTENQIDSLTTKLSNSNKEHRELLIQNNIQKDALAQQMQALYTSGKQSHLRLLLKQDDPSDISRTVKYFEYMNQHRIKHIGLIKTRLDKIEKLQIQINKDSDTLSSLQKTQLNRKASLKKAVLEKESAYKKQKKVVYSQEQKLAKLRKEESRLQSVIEELAKKRKREEDKRIADKKAAELAKKQSEKKEQKKVIAKTVTRTPKKENIPVQTYIPNKPFSTLKGKISWPVSGKVTQKYGSTRNSKQKWKGVILSANAGSKVRAVARGKVEFSGRLKGYGYLVIVRHDKNYRSLYAYNRSVFKKEGQIVKAGEVIAAVGNSGSQADSGLYFEIRKGTAPQNPHSWVKK